MSNRVPESVLQHSLKDLARYLEDAVRHGSVQGVDNLDAALVSELNLPEGVLARHRARADAERQRWGMELPELIRAEAERLGYQVEVRLPYVQIGCVRFQQGAGQSDTWSVSILDSTTIETLPVSPGDELVKCADRHIRRIAERLKSGRSFGDALEKSCRALALLGVVPAPICLVMLMCGCGKRIDRALAHGTEKGQWEGMSRAEFSYLLRAITVADGTTFELRKATQRETKHDKAHVFLPTDTDPHSIPASPAPYCAISLRTAR